MPFDAAEAVPELEWSFHTLYLRKPEAYPGLKDAHGVTDEPSDDDIERFQKAMATAMGKAVPDGVDPTDRAAVARASQDMPDGQFKEIQDSILDAVAELTKGSPSREQLAALPFRHKRRYIESLQRDLVDPEGAAAATNS